MERQTPFLRSLAIQVRVIGALAMRELLTRYGRGNIGFLWLFIGPILILAAITLVYSFTRSGPYVKVGVIPFCLTGYAFVLLWRGMPSRCTNSVDPNRNLLYHRNVRVLDLYFARILVEVSGVTISFFLLTFILVFFGWMLPPTDILTVLFGWAMVVWLCSALALVVGAMGELFDAWAQLWMAFTHILFPLSGSLFLVDWLPPKWGAVVLWIPLVNAIELLREGFFGSAIKTHYDLQYLVFWSMSLTLLGLALVKKAASETELE